MFAPRSPALISCLVLAACSMNQSARTDSSAAAADASIGTHAQTSISADARVLDGREKSIVVVGYSTSYAWPDILQEMLDEHAGGERIYHVLNAVQGGAPVQMWIEDPGHRDYERTITAMLRDFWGDQAKLRGDAPQPMVAICQQSLQLTAGFQRGPVTTKYDMVGAERGADDMQKMALRLKGHGLEQVHIAMHIYKQPVEPEVGNERIALRRLLKRGLDFIYEGPDLWQASYDEYPEAFTEDKLHPNERGNKLMAIGWYRSLAGDAARQDIIERIEAKSYDITKMMRAYLAWRRSTVDTD